MIKTEAESAAILSMLTQTSSWNPHARFLVFVDWLDRDWQEFAIFIIKMFWQYFVINITIMIPPNVTVADAKVRVIKLTCVPYVMYAFKCGLAIRQHFGCICFFAIFCRF